MHGLAVNVKEGLLLHGTYLQKTVQILTYVFDWLYFTQCLTSFPSINHILCLYTQFFIPISFNTDEVLYINASPKVFVYVDFNICHKDQLITYSGGTDRPGELVDLVIDQVN